MNNFFKKKKKYLYLITPPQLLTKRLPLPKYLKILNEVLKTKKIKFLQLRLKNKTKKQILNTSKAISYICKKNRTIFFINDYADDEIIKCCDGIHLGQKDISLKKVYKIIAKKKFLGITCHNSKSLVRKAMQLNPSYISLGSFFNTKTKKIKFRAKIKNIDWFKKNFSLPCAAIGGIDLKNCKKIIKTKCDLIAISSGVWDFDKGPVEAVKLFNNIINKKK
tara:strand:+ start:2610 stop:3272 length:663 start_codon:yes stop_codon:yes gene_type:complete